MIMISNPAAESQWNRPMATRRESSLKKNEKRVLLGANYIPGRNSVICGRGKACTSSPGNKKLRGYVDSFAKSYGSASNKDQKSKIVSTIISLIEEPEGGAFVKFEESAWWKVDEAYAREKIGNLFRDVLHTKYRSSSKAKQARKHKVASSVSGGFNEEIETIATKLSMDQSNSSTSSSGSTMCTWNLDAGCGINNNNHGLRPSSIGFPLGGAMSCMSYGIRESFDFPQQTLFHPNARRNMLLNYCQEALHITSSDATRMSRAALYNNVSDMASFNNMMMQSAAARCTALAVVTPDKSSSSRIREPMSPAASSKVRDDGGANVDDNDDEVSIATLSGDDDIFSDFLDGRIDDLSGIF
jgi:hypothetical protein